MPVVASASLVDPATTSAATSAAFPAVIWIAGLVREMDCQSQSFKLRHRTAEVSVPAATPALCDRDFQALQARAHVHAGGGLQRHVHAAGDASVLALDDSGASATGHGQAGAEGGTLAASLGLLAGPLAGPFSSLQADATAATWPPAAVARLARWLAQPADRPPDA